MLPGEKQPFIVHCGNKKCNHEWAIGFLPMDLSIIGKFKNTKCPICQSKNALLGPFPRETKEGDPMAWLVNGDTGISSKTIWSIMMGREIKDPYFHASPPSDPSDFGRCYRLLKVMPSWRERLPEISEKYPKWKPLIDHWDELTSLYEEEIKNPSSMAPKLYKRMKELENEKNL